MPTLGEKGILPMPGSSRRPRTYFPSNPTSQTSLLTHLRSRTRLTNLAVTLILLLTTSSLLLNGHYYLTPHRHPYYPGAALYGSRTPHSIEDTIDRDPRMGKLDHMIMVPGHAIWLGAEKGKVEQDDEWVLDPMQKGGSVRTFLRHVEMGVEAVKEDERALLVFSGGATRPPPSPPISEAQSYHALALTLDLITLQAPTSAHEPLPLNMRVATEEYAMDSYQNLLFSIARFKEVTGRWPGKITVVGYGMKRRRFELLHARAIGWPGTKFDYIGIDDDGDTTEHYAGELKYGFTPFLSSPSGCHPPLSTKKQFRNPFARYHPYHISTPELAGLFEWCPLPKEREDVGDDGEGIDVYPGQLPWRDGVKGGKGFGGEWWDRERD